MTKKNSLSRSKTVLSPGENLSKIKTVKNQKLKMIKRKKEKMKKDNPEVFHSL